MVRRSVVAKCATRAEDNFWHPSRVRFGFDGVPGVSLTLNPRLMSGSPSGCPDGKAAPGTAAFLRPNHELASLFRSANREKMSKPKPQAGKSALYNWARLGSHSKARGMRQV